MAGSTQKVSSITSRQMGIYIFKGILCMFFTSKRKHTFSSCHLFQGLKGLTKIISGHPHPCMKKPNCRVFGKFVRCHSALIFPWLPASTQLYSAINHTELLKPVKNVQKSIHLSSLPSIGQKHINYKAWVNTVHHLFHRVLQGTTIWKWQHGILGEGGRGRGLKWSCKFSWRCTVNGSRILLPWGRSRFLNKFILAINST